MYELLEHEEFNKYIYTIYK